LKKLPAVATLLVFIVGGLLWSCSRPAAPRKHGLAITHVTVIDATGSTPQPDRTVLISDQKVAAVTPTGAAQIPQGAQILDASGKFLIPGLADMHVHLTGAGEPSGSREFILPWLIANGITTVRDMGGDVFQLFALRNEIESGRRLGPQIFFAGPYLDGDPPGYQPSIAVKTGAEARKAVDQLVGQGVDFIKTQSRLDREAYFAIAEESKLLQVRFVGHVPDSVSALEASKAGQASIEHLTGVLLACSSKEKELRRDQFTSGLPNATPQQALQRSRAWQRKLLDTYSEQKAETLFRAFVEDDTWQVPTFPINVHFGFMTPKTDLSNDARMIYIPRNERKIWREGIQERLEYRSDPDFSLREEIVKRYLDLVGKMQAAGVRIMVGTDIAAPNVFPGFSLHEDLASLVQAGLTPMQALQAATRSPAKFLGKLQTQGTIEPGKAADLVLLDANPLDDIHNTQKIHAVIVRGKLFDRAALDALLAVEEKFASTH